MGDTVNRTEALSLEEKRAKLKALLQKKAQGFQGQGRQAIQRVDRDQPLPLSFAQQRLWFLDQLDPGSPAYNISEAVRLTGRLDKAAMERALREIVRRHESLRTSFREVEDQPVQVIDPEVRLTLPVVDLRHLAAEQREAQVLRLAEADARNPFDLAAGPMLRTTLLQLSEEEHVLLLTMHHIASDGWSMGIFGQELATLYGAFMAGQLSPLPELPLQYADFAQWQRNWLQGEVLEEQLAYWKKQLAGVPVLQLPTDRPLPAVKTYNGATQGLALSPELAAAIKALSRQEGTTLFMTLLAAFQTLLCRYTGQEDISVGTPVANRHRLETEGLIGLFANTVVLRTDLSGNPTFRELLGRVREVTLGAYTYQDVPFEKLVEVLKPERALSHDPLFQVMFTLESASGAAAGLPGLTLSSLSVGTGTAKFALELGMEESDQGLACKIGYNTDLFDRTTITRMLTQWQTLLEAIVSDPEQRVATLPLLTPEERQQVLFGWNQTSSRYAQEVCIHQLIEAQVERTPHAVAVVCADERLSYQELNGRANKLAHYLRGQGVGRDVLVGVCMERSPEMLVGLLAVLKAGGAYVPIDPAYPAERIAGMLADAQPALLLTQERLAAKLPESGARVLLVDGEAPPWAGESEANPIAGAAPEDLAYVIFTSGTTGRPKGVMVEHRNVVAYIHAFTRQFGPLSDQVVLQLAPFSFDTFVEEVYPTLAGGGRLVLPVGMEFLDMANFARLVQVHGVTQVSAPPLLLAEMNEVEGLDSVRTWISGGDVLKPEYVSNLVKTGAVYNTYGPTETTVCAAYYRYTGDESGRSIPLGRPIANWRIYMLDGAGNPVPPGVAGELCIAGAGVSRGYLHRDDLTAERFAADPWVPGDRMYRTGDLARFLPNGEIEYVGRLDHQVKIRGFRVELGEIEAVLVQHPGVRDAVVVAREDQPGSKRLAAYVVAAGAPGPDSSELREFLRTKLPDYMVPAAFVMLPALPLTANGKVDRQALPAPEGGREQLSSSYAPPRTPVEEALADIWAELLGLDRVGIHDHFFDLGGHSLLATRVIARARAALGVDLRVRSLFEAATVAELAEKVEAALRQQQTGSAQPIERVNRNRPAPLSFAQQRLWFLAQMNRDTATYNVPEAVRLTGRLDKAALERALREIVRRHETLRTTFQTVDGEPVQVVAPEVTLTLPVIDLRDLPEGEREARAQQLADEEAKRPFDLAVGPVLRTKLLQLAEEEHVLLLTMHHITSDGWSMEIFGQEIAALYTAFVAGRPSPLPELPLQYAHFAQWQRNWLQGEVLEGQLAYWKQQLAGAPVLQLPTDRPRPPVKSYRGAVQGLRLSAELTRALKALSRRERTTLFMTLLAAFQTLLYRYTGQDDISVGTPVANRNRLETEGLIGFFVNTLVMRTSLSGNPPFRELLGRVREVALGAFTNQDVPFEKLVEVLQPERAMSHDPLFQVAFTLQSASGGAVELPGLKLSSFSTAATTSKFDLDLSLSESEEGLTGGITYNTDLFDSATIVRLIGHWQTLLEAIVADPEQRVGNLPLLTAKERQQLLLDWNQTAAACPQEGLCIHQLVAEQAERTPHALAVSSGEGSLTYQELNQRANKLAHFLRDLGAGPDVLVGLCMERSLEMMVGMLAVLKIGGAYVPIDPAYPAERIAHILTDAQVPVLLTQARLAPQLPESGARVIVVDRDLQAWADKSEANPITAVAANHLAYVIYTSGSTGRPKGVEVPHGALLNLVWWFRRAYGLTPADRVTFNSGIGFDASVSEIWPALSAGASLHLPDEESRMAPENLRDWLVEERVTVAFAATPMAELLLGLPWPDGTALRVLYAGGDKLRLYPPPGLPFRVANDYGPTECACISTHADVPAACGADTVPHIGRPIDNVQVYMLDQHLQPVPVGVPGELYIGGKSVARGYRNQPELTRERFLPNPFGDGRLYRTGDQARYRPDGNIEYLGRIDHQVKIRGFRIELGEIEAVLAQHLDVRESAVVVREDQPGNKRLVAYVVVRDGAALEADRLRQYLRAQLPQYMVPAVFVSLPALPLNASGKVDRQGLPPPAEGRDDFAAPYVAPRTPVEEVLAGIWADVLGLKQVGVSDHFFDLGGHSLLVTQVTARVRMALGVDLPVRSLFEAPTVEALAVTVEAALRQERPWSTQPIERAERDQALPPSFAQQRLWFLEQLEPGTAAYNIPEAVRLTGRLNAAALEQALREIVRRHESLRTAFRAVDGQPVQVIDPEVRLTLPVVDLRDLPEPEREVRARQLAEAESRRPFDLAAGPLLRTTLLQLAAEEHVLLLTLHHIASDGWSMGVLGRELAALYEAFVAGRPSPLPELPVQYADFACWQRNWLQGDVLEAQLDYWRQQLTGVPVLQLPTDRPAPPVKTYSGATLPIELPPELARALKLLSRREGTTLFMTLLAAFQTLLCRYAGQEDISVGTPVANRNRLETEGLIGFFVNTLVMRTDLSGNPTFRELLGRVREVALGAYTNQDVPFEKLVEVLKPQRALSHDPLFQVMFMLQTQSGSEAGLPGLTLSPLAVENTTAKFILELSLVESEQGLTGGITYNTDLFDTGTIARMAGHWQTLLEAIVADPDQRVASLPLLPAAERQQLLVDWNQTAAEYPRNACLHHLFEAQAEQTPHAAAVESSEGSLTYGELNRRANRLAHYLRRLGVGPDVLVGLCMERSLEMVVGLLAILKAGGGYVPVDPAYPAERIAYMLTDAQVPVLLAQERLAERLPGGGARVILVDREAETWAGECEANPESGVGPEHLAYVIYTSGSTGRPKGAMIHHCGVVNYLTWCTRAYDIAAGEGAPVHSSIAFDLTVTSLFGPLVAGKRVVLVAEEDRGEALGKALLSHERFSLAKITPAHLNLLAQQLPADRAAGRAKVLVIGGEALTGNDIAFWQQHAPGTRLMNEYGPTETVVGCCVYEVPASQGSGAVPIGRPIANTRLYVLDQQMQPVPIGVPGELYIGGDGVARGYLNRPELTAERFLADPFSQETGARLYKTGDLVRYRPDGTLEYLGRTDHQVKVRGFRIELGEIEAVLVQHPTVREAAVMAREDQPGNKWLVAYVAVQGESEPDPAELRQFLRAKLPEYMVPAVFVTLPALPLTTNGKVDRQALPAPEGGREWLSVPYEPPRTRAEEVLAAIWADLLGVDMVGIHDHFFELGGHSLLATKVVARVREALGVDLSLRSLFETPTVAELAERIAPDPM